MPKRTNKPAAAATHESTPEAPAALAATETAPEQAAAPADAAPADPAAPPESPQAAPPASAEPLVSVELDAPGRTVDDVALDAPVGALTHEQRASLAALAAGDASDTTQETLEKQAEVQQPEAPVLDRVLRRLAATHDEPDRGQYCSPSPSTRLHGDTIVLNRKPFEAMVAEGVPAHDQGDTLQFLLEQLAGAIKGGF